MDILQIMCHLKLGYQLLANSDVILNGLCREGSIEKGSSPNVSS